MTQTLATAVDLLAAIDGGELPDTAARLLDRATALVLDACALDRWTVDDDGAPISQAIRDALRDAATVQVVTWIAAGIDPDTEGLTATTVRASSSIGSASISHAGATEAVASRARVATHLTPAALSILRRAGLASAHVWGW